MSIKRFVDLGMGDKFNLNGVEYTKIPEERISCCKALNAQTVSEPHTKIQVVPITEVEVQD
jgi:hypothetical protein